MRPFGVAAGCRKEERGQTASSGASARFLIRRDGTRRTSGYALTPVAGLSRGADFVCLALGDRSGAPDGAAFSRPKPTGDSVENERASQNASGRRPPLVP